MSSVASRRKNPLNLSLPATVKENGDSKDDENSRAKPFSLENQIRQMTLTESQKSRMQEWINEKKLVKNFLAFQMEINSIYISIFK